MIVIRLSGGLGNQMLQYSLFLYLTQKKKKTILDLSSYKYVNEHNGIELFDSFDIKTDRKLRIRLYYYKKRERIVNFICEHLSNNLNLKIFTKWKIRHLIPFPCKKYNYSILDIDQSLVYDYNLIDNVIIKGSVIPYDLIVSVEDELKKQFAFKSLLNEQVLKDIENSNSVSIHVRRGDFITCGYPVLDFDYYKRAIDYIENKELNCKFFIFTNDIKWCKEHFISEKFTIVESKGKSSYIDMSLMSKCKHNIIANSSFSWWSAFLNKNENKLVLCPMFLGYLKITEKMLPEKWIKI